MNAEALKAACLGFTGAEETYPFGTETAVFKVEGKMFALSQFHADDLKISLKCEPELAEQLRATHPEIVPGYHLNKRHWNTVSLTGGLDESMIRDLIEDSYDLVVSKLPKAKRLRLGWEPEGLS